METRREKKVEGDGAVPIWDCGSALYDSLELTSLCHILDRHLMVLPFSMELARQSGRICDEPDEIPRRLMMVMVGGRAKEEKSKKLREVGFRALCGAIAFWRRK